MKSRKLPIVALLLLTASAGVLRAQTTTPAVPAVPAVPPQASGIVGLVQMAAAACKACKAKLCACPLGQLLSNAFGPLNAVSGGLLCQPCCPPVSDEDKKKPATTAGGACAKITMSNLDAPNRVKAVKCLAYQDCHWWPEAEVALIASLRTDPSECVRLAAAQALLSGCCCTKNTIEALAVVVSKSDKDGNPSENSERVLEVAFLALQNCLLRYSEPAQPLEQPGKPAPKKVALDDPNVQPIAYYVQLDRKPMTDVLAEARRAVDRPLPVRQTYAPPSGQRSLLSMVVNTRLPSQTTPQTSAPPAASDESAVPSPQSQAEPSRPSILSLQSRPAGKVE